MIANSTTSLSKFVKDIITFILITGISRLLPFLLTPIFTNYISPLDMGALEIILALYSILIVIGLFQIDTSFQRYFYEEKNIISSSLCIIIILSIISSLILYAFSSMISIYISGTETHVYSIRIVSYTVPFTNIYSLLILALRFSNKTKELITLILLQSFSFSSLAYVFVIYKGNGIQGYLSASLYSYIFVVLLAFLYFKKQLISNINMKFIWKLIKFAYPQTPARLASTFMQNGNRFVILLLLGESSVGIFSVGNKMSILMNIVLSAFNMVWYPILYKDTKKINNHELNNIYKITLLSLPIITIFLSFISYFIFCNIIDSRYQSGFSTSLILILSSSILIIKEIADIGIKIKEKTYFISIIYITSLLLSYFLMLILSPSLQLIGIALAMLIANIAMLSMTWFISTHLLKPFPFNIKYTYMYFIFSIVFVIIIMKFNYVT